MKVDILTRHTRSAEYVARVKSSLQGSERWFLIGDKPSEVDFVNYLYYFGAKPDYGHRLNIYLDRIPDEGQWVYILDDDNLLHPKFHECFSLVDPDCQLIIFNQQVSPEQVRVAHPDHLWVEWIDSAQYVATRKFIGDLRHWNVYRHDGYFLMELVIRSRYEGVKYQILPSIHAYHNAQHWIR